MTTDPNENKIPRSNRNAVAGEHAGDALLQPKPAVTVAAMINRLMLLGIATSTPWLHQVAHGEAVGRDPFHITRVFFCVRNVRGPRVVFQTSRNWTSDCNVPPGPDASLVRQPSWQPEMLFSPPQVRGTEVF
jgi:hypothetical protein